VFRDRHLNDFECRDVVEDGRVPLDQVVLEQNCLQRGGNSRRSDVLKNRLFKINPVGSIF
jgi:hypothetical protein